MLLNCRIASIWCPAIILAGFFANQTSAQPMPERSAQAVRPASSDEPCEKMKSCAFAITQFSITTHYQTAFGELKTKAQEEAHHEFIVSFGKDSSGQVITSPISTGNRTNAVVPAIDGGFADLHNHPRKTPPSSGDLYGLLMKNRRNSHYTTRYILTSDQVVYALVVFDTAAAHSFLALYPPQKLSGYSPLFPDDLLNEYREMQQHFGASEELAMAYLLEKYATGVILLKQVNQGNFTVIRTAVSGDGDAKIFVSVGCN